MKTALLSFTLMCSIVANAQQPVFNWYTAEGKDYYEARGLKPGANASFYSTHSGGRLIVSEPVSNTGVVTHEGSKDFRPAFVLGDGVKGTNFVAHLGEKDFSFATPIVSSVGSVTKVCWEAWINEDNVSFQVLRSFDGLNWQTVATIDAKRCASSLLYSFDEHWNGAAMLYKVAVMSKTKGVRYTSRQIALTENADITIFPTNISDGFFIALPFINSSTYQIISLDGKVVMKGNLFEKLNSISLGSLASGNYLVTIQNGSEKKTAKIVKL